MPERISLFPMAETWWVYGVFLLLVFAMLALDLGVFHKKSHVVGVRESAAWSVVWVTLATAFGGALWGWAAASFPTNARLMAIPGFDPSAAAERVFFEFLTGFVIEKALAVDNLFVFVIVFSYFAIPAALQHRVLFFGILGALGFRAVFIALGSWLMQVHWVVVLAGLFLVFTGVKLAFAGEAQMEPDKNLLVRLVRRWLPITGTLRGDRFFVVENGLRHGTPLLLALAVIELSDVVFAVDSVPAIYAVTSEPLLVFTSNIFAILGLRSLYFLLAGVMDRFHLLKYGLAVILVFVGLKMSWLNAAFDGKFPISWSLGVIGAVLAASIAACFWIPPKGTVRATG